MDKIIDRILHKLGDSDLIDKLLLLPKSDLNTLLIKIYEKQAEITSPMDVVKAYNNNRFTEPSEIDPAKYHAFESEMLSLVKASDIKGILLSPVAPIYSCSAFGCVNQNNIVSALRGTEVLSDPTNMIAVYIADKLRKKELNNQTSLHFCTTARVLRAQPFPKEKGFYTHFGLYCMVSTCKDVGSYQAEKELLLKHLSFMKQLFQEKYKANLSITLRKRSGYTDNDGFFSRMTELVKKELPDVTLTFDLEHEDNNYYKGINYKIYMQKSGENIEVGDGGFVDWIQRMTGNKKERCLITGLSIDRLLIL